MRSLPDARWSQTNKAWHIPLNEAACKIALEKLRPVANIDTTVLSAYLHKRKAVQATLPTEKHQLPTQQPLLTAPQTNVYGKISNQNLAELEKMVLLLKGKAYSTSTINTYRSEIMQLLRVMGSKPVQALTPPDLMRYMVFAMDKEGISEHTAHSRINSLKFYFEQVLGRKKFFFEIPRPKKPQLLPKVLGENELERLFTALTNKKHKAILFTAYSAGLRVSESVALKQADIDSGRMQIFVGRAKGKKDRYVPLSPIVLDILRNYLLTSPVRPLVYLFEGATPGQPYPTRTAQQIFYNARNKAGILKSVSFHSLRHSFATHLLEKGVDIKYIKDLLGHFDIKTTERYLHVTKDKLITIVSPLDDLWKRGGLEI